MKKIPVFIPSYGRSDRVTTLAMLPSVCRPILCVRKSQWEAYVTDNPEIEVLVIPDNFKGIAGARTWICKRALARGMNIIGMLDDDMRGGWFRKKDPRTFGGLKKATPEQVVKQWLYHERNARHWNRRKEGYAISMSDRRVLAYAKTRTDPIHIGLIGRCIIINKMAMETAQFTINACEDVESTLAWLCAGVYTGQDTHFGHGGHEAWATTADAGGVGALRAKQANLKTKNHKRLMQLFPDCVGYTSTGKERTWYRKAAQIGGLVP